ncbi:MAG: type IX secretion system membrane protein PorP/SprF [Bacteroidota bacterium]
MKQFVLLFGLCVVLTVAASAQVFFQNTMYPYTRFMYNPAAAGMTNPGMEAGANFTMMGRQQWLGVPGAPRTPVFAFNAPLPNDIGGIGATVGSDILGPVTSTWLDVAYAYHLDLGGTFQLNIGASGGFRNFNIDASGWKYDQSSGIDPIVPTVSRSVLVPTINAGIYLSTVGENGRDGNFFVGLSGQNLLEPSIEDVLDVIGIGPTSRIPRTFSLMGGYRFDLDDRMSIQPIVNFQTDGVNTPQTSISVYWNYKPVSVGANFRAGDTESLGAILGFNVSDQMFFGYSYDYPLTSLNGVGDLHTHEIILSYTLRGAQGNGGKKVNILKEGDL